MIRIIDAKPAPKADCAQCTYCNFYEESNSVDCLRHGDIDRAAVKIFGCRDYSREDY